MSNSTVTATLNLTLSAAVIVDLNTTWMQNRGNQQTVLQALVGASDTTISALFQTPPEVGSAILVDGEPMIVTGLPNGSVVPVQRAATAFPFLALLPTAPPTSHGPGSSVVTLRYSNPFEMIADLAMRPWVQQQVNNLGSKSATFGTLISGSLAMPPA